MRRHPKKALTRRWVILLTIGALALAVISTSYSSETSPSSRILASASGKPDPSTGYALASALTKIVQVDRFYVRGYGRNISFAAGVECLSTQGGLVQRSTIRGRKVPTQVTVPKMRPGRLYALGMPSKRSKKCDARVGLTGQGAVRVQILG